MEMMRYEWKKWWYGSRGYWILVLFVFLELVLLFVTDRPYTLEIEENREAYTLYLSEVEGEIDEASRSFFARMDERFQKAESRLQRIYGAYSDGALEESAYRAELLELSELLRTREGYDTLYEQYIYARESPKDRYLLNTNGWNALLAKEQLDPVLLLTILVFALWCFGREISSEMDAMMKLCVHGERKTAGVKLVLVTGMSGGLCLWAYGLRVLFFGLRYGFFCGNAPIQSLETYQEYTGHASLYGAAAGVLGFQLIGCVLWGMLVSAAVVWLRKYALAMLSTLAGLLLPYYGLSTDYIKYFLPGPLGFLAATGYYRGTVLQYNAQTGQQLCQFLQVPQWLKVVLIFVNLGLFLLLACFIKSRYTNQWRKGRRKGAVALFMLLCLCGMVSGCKREEMVSASVYNLDNRLQYESEAYLVYVEYTEEQTSQLTVQEKATGQTFPLIQDVFQEKKEIYPFFYGDGEWIYYLERGWDHKERYFSSPYAYFAIKGVNLRDFESRTIYRKTADWALYAELIAFLVKEEAVYFITSDGVYAAEGAKGAAEKLFSYTGSNVAYQDGQFFYTDFMSRLHRYSVEEKKSIELSDIVAKQFLLGDGEVFFTDLGNHARLTACDFQSGETRVLLEQEPLDFFSDGEMMFVIEKNTSMLYELDPDQGKREALGVAPGSVLYVFSDYGAVLAPDLEAGGRVELLKGR